MGATKSVHQMTRKMKKEDRELREENEAELVKKKTKPKITLPLSDAAKKMFNSLKKRYVHLTVDESDTLTLLAYALNEISKNMEEQQHHHILSEEYRDLKKNISDYNKQVMQYMSVLSIHLKDKLQLSNEMTKIAIEERKLDAMNETNQQTINPKQEKLMHILNK
ncbi:hypothetical protein [Bacillus sp. N6]|uniref:hypothetical protein n=1 Tax=Bacillus sp. N6 TaxID=127893 RepID=UPI004057809A